MSYPLEQVPQDDLVKSHEALVKIVEHRIWPELHETFEQALEAVRDELEFRSYALDEDAPIAALDDIDPEPFERAFEAEGPVE